MKKIWRSSLNIFLLIFVSTSFAMEAADSEKAAKLNKRKRGTLGEETQSESTSGDLPFYESIMINDKEVFKNRNGDLFYGCAKNVPVAQDLQREAMRNIIGTLYGLENKLERDQFHTASLTLWMLNTLLSENHQICQESWSRFVMGKLEYKRYSPEPRLMLEPEHLDIPLQERARAYYDTLFSAFAFAQQRNLVVDFFNHAFVKQSGASICLRIAQADQKRWLDKAISRFKEQRR